MCCLQYIRTWKTGAKIRGERWDKLNEHKVRTKKQQLVNQ